MNNNLNKKITHFSVLRFAFPSIVMMVIMSLYTVVDGIFVSRLIGTSAFSAVNIIYPMMGITIGLGTMFGAGVTAIVSIKLGENKLKEANQNLTFIIMFSIFLSVLLSVICLIFLKQIIMLLGANQDIYQYCYEYAFPLVFFFFANILQFQFQNLYVAKGRQHIGLILTIIGGLTNIILDYVFIAKLNMGISGAAIATGIGYSIPAIFGLLYFGLNRKGTLYFVKPKWEGKVLLSTMSNGSSEMVSYLSTSITTFLFNIIMMRLIGENGVAAVAILLYLDFILVAISLGYSMGVSPLISYNYGASNKNNIKKIFKISCLFSIFIGIIMTMLAIVFSSQLVSIFTDRGNEVFLLAVNGLVIYAFGYLFKGYNIFASAMFTAFSNGKISAIISTMRSLLFLVSALLILSHLFGVKGVWIATPIAELLAVIVAIVFTICYSKRYEYLTF